MKEIIFIIGPSRSGSSLLEARLNSRAGVKAFGELRWFFRRGFINNEICSCAKKFHDCNYWSQYKRILTPKEAYYCDDLRSYFDRLANLFPLYFKFLRSKKWQKNWLAYSNYLSNLYTRLSLESEVIVDNSKSPFYFYVLESCLKGKFRVVPVLYDRQAAAIVESYSKNKVRKESNDQEMMRKKTATHVILYLIAIRLIFILISKTRESTIKVSYRDICFSEDATIEKILGPNLKLIDSSNYHSVSGNPDRISGFHKIKYDEKFARGRFDILFTICKFIDKISFFKC